jgi:hypothetical protein
MTKSRNIRPSGANQSGIPRVPSPDSASGKAGELIYRSGPISEAALFKAVDFGRKPSVRTDRLERAIFGGWLVREGDLISISEFAREHFDGEAQAKKYVGEVAGPRHVDLMNSKAYVPERRRVLRDVPDWSKREVPNFHKG